MPFPVGTEMETGGSEKKLGDGVPHQLMENAAPSWDVTWKLLPFPCWPGSVGQAEMEKHGFQPSKKLGIESVSGKGKYERTGEESSMRRLKESAMHGRRREEREGQAEGGRRGK
jgi:hypothetical protein